MTSILRQRMLDAMVLSGKAARTQEAYIGAVFGLASIVGPLAGGWITDHLSWRWAFYVNAPLGILAAIVLYRTFPFVKPHASRSS